MQNMKAASLGAATTAIGQQARPSTQFDTVSEALNFAQGVVDRVEGLANRLCGCVPQSGETNGISETPDGILARMAMQAQYTHSRLVDAMEALARIERALP